MQEGVLYLQYYSSYAAVNYSGLFYTAVPGAKCPWGELSWGELSWGELSLGRVVREPSCTLSPRQYKPPVEQ
jgi:hypothetical protein